jgi:hypothetical protein
MMLLLQQSYVGLLNRDGTFVKGMKCCDQGWRRVNTEGRVQIFRKRQNIWSSHRWQIKLTNLVATRQSEVVLRPLVDALDLE